MLLSAVCGISYEILYSKFLGNLLGQQFTTNAAVLISFLAGIGLGGLYAHRFTKYLWAIEAGIGFYAIALSISQESIEKLIYEIAPSVGATLSGTTLSAILILATPAFLVGNSIPIFSAYLAERTPKSAFIKAYGIYNFGAVLTVLALEFFVLRHFGLTSALQGLGLLNIAIGICIYFLKKPKTTSTHKTRKRNTYPQRLLGSLFLISMASACFQMLNIKIFEALFGPFNETFALVLAVTLLSLSIGSVWANWQRFNYYASIITALIGLILFLVGFEYAAIVHATLYTQAAATAVGMIALKFGIICALILVPAIGFAATLPLILRTYRDVATDSGFLLFISSMGNVCGFFLMAFVLHRYVDYGVIVLIIFLLSVIALFLHHRRVSKWLTITLLLMPISGYAHKLFWSEDLLFLGHDNFNSMAEFTEARKGQSQVQNFRGAQDVFALVTQGGHSYFYINGYISIVLESTAEKRVGAISAMFAPRRDNALVLGVGSGATAGTVALLFDRTEAVEVNQVVLDNLHLMNEHNFDIDKRESISLIHGDGSRYLKSRERDYTLILNTVTSPRYFSSSKLYTADFFKTVKRNLSEDGIYVTWVDTDIGSEGVNIVLKTLDQQFGHCGTTFIRSSYFLFICSDEPIQLHGYADVTRNEQLSEYFASEGNFPIEFLPYALLSTDVLTPVKDIYSPTNTNDLPVLEHLMTRLISGSLANFRTMIGNSRNTQTLMASMKGQMDWQPAEFFYFAEAKSSRLSALAQSVLGDEFEVNRAEYAEAVIRFAWLLDTERGYRAAIENLSDRDECDAAHELLEKHAFNTLKDGNYLIGKCYYFSDSFGSALSHFKKQWTETRLPKTPIYIARTLIKQGEFLLALEWLEIAKQVTPADSRVSFYKGQAYLGVGDLDNARRAFRKGANDPSSRRHNRAKRELLRLETAVE